jgi:hypothetical protein
MLIVQGFPQFTCIQDFLWASFGNFELRTYIWRLEMRAKPLNYEEQESTRR